MVVGERERGDNGMFITLVPKFLYYFLFVGLKTLGTLVNFDWLIHKVECSNFSVTNFNLVILSIIIGDVHQFIGHCLIP